MLLGLQQSLGMLFSLITRNSQLWMIMYRLDMFESISNLELIGKKCMGSLHPLCLIPLQGILGYVALITVKVEMLI